MTTEINLIKETFERFKTNFNNNSFSSLEKRVFILNQCKDILIKNEKNLYEALSKDYGYRSEYDSMISDLIPSVQGIHYTTKNLRKWMKASKRKSGISLAPSKVTVYYQPLGVVGVVVPWNFPLFLSISPITAALAAGNKVLVKMSELTPNTNKVLKEIFKPLKDDLSFFEGEVEVSSFFTNLPFDHLIFTGSTGVGKIVAKSAAQNLTPTTLELGGKSPVIIAPDANLKNTIHSIVAGKTLNSGQICIAPDYVFVPNKRKKEFIELFQKSFEENFQETGSKFKMTRIVSKNHFERLSNYLVDAESKGAEVITIRRSKGEDNLLYPHLVADVTDEMKIMQEEIFGPLLPIMTYENIEETFEYILNHPRPLALYLFSEDEELINRVIYNTHSGGVCINDTIIHAAAEDAPFGGIGESGIGHYHGREGFLTFSKAKTVLSTPTWLPRTKYLLSRRDKLFETFRALFLK